MNIPEWSGCSCNFEFKEKLTMSSGGSSPPWLGTKTSYLKEYERHKFCKWLSESDDGKDQFF